MSADATGKPDPAEVSALTRYWAAVNEGRFVIPECNGCERRFLPPRMFCPACGSDSLRWIESGGRGRIYSFSVVEKAVNPKFSKSVPFIIAVAELDDLSHGSRFYARLVDVDPEKVRVGQTISVAIRQLEDSRALPVLIPARNV